MKTAMKRIASFLLVGVLTVAAVPSAFAAETDASVENTSSTTVVARMGGTSTTPVLPKNITGADSIVVWRTGVAASDIGETFRVKVTNFTNGMDTVNVAIQIGGQYIAGSFGMRSGDSVTFDVPDGTQGQMVEIYMSTDSNTPGTCRLTIGR